MSDPSRQPGRPARSDAGPEPDSMLPLWRRINVAFIRHGQRWQLPTGLLLVLIGLHRHPETDEPAGIARLHSFPRQTTTFILDALEKRRLAVRRPHPHDRRRKQVRLTAKGDALGADILEDLHRFEARALSALRATEIAAARRFLTRYADALDQACPPAPTP